MQDIQMGQKHPQVENRASRTFFDQHRRPWTAVIENKTGHPVAPPSPKFSAPVYPPSKYVLVVAGDAGELFIDYMAWQRDLMDANAAVEQRRFDIAQAEYKEAAPEALAKVTPFLEKAVGDRPMHPDIPRACLAGNKFILGFTTQKPDWAKKYFPDITPEQTAAAAAAEFPDVEDENATAAAPVTFPHNYAPGRWRLSNEQVLQGNRAEAEAAEEALAQFAET